MSPGSTGSFYLGGGEDLPAIARRFGGRAVRKCSGNTPLLLDRRRHGREDGPPRFPFISLRRVVNPDSHGVRRARLRADRSERCNSCRNPGEGAVAGSRAADLVGPGGTAAPRDSACTEALAPNGSVSSPSSVVCFALMNARRFPRRYEPAP